MCVVGMGHWAQRGVWFCVTSVCVQLRRLLLGMPDGFSGSGIAFPVAYLVDSSGVRRVWTLLLRGPSDVELPQSSLKFPVFCIKPPD